MFLHIMDLATIKTCLLKANQEPEALASTSEIWKRCETALSYVWELGPESLSRIRLHAELFNSESMHELFFGFPNRDGKKVAKSSGYAFVTEDIPERFHIGEPPVPGLHALGAEWNGRALNKDLARYQTYLSNFYRTGMFAGDARKTILEIGSGYGAIPCQLHTLMPGRITTILVDLPLLLLYAASYILTRHPGLRVYVYNPDAPEPLTDESLSRYDLVLIPPHRLHLLEGISRIDYAINTVSFAEMPDEQLHAYFGFLRPRLHGYLFSDNYEWGKEPPLRHLLAKYFTLTPSVESWEHRTVSAMRLPRPRNFLRMFFCTVRPEAATALDNIELRLPLPYRRKAKIRLGASIRMPLSTRLLKELWFCKQVIMNLLKKAAASSAG